MLIFGNIIFRATGKARCPDAADKPQPAARNCV